MNGWRIVVTVAAVVVVRNTITDDDDDDAVNRHLAVFASTTYRYHTQHAEASTYRKHCCNVTQAQTGTTQAQHAILQ